MPKLRLLFLSIFIAQSLLSQEGRAIVFPDIPGYKTLKTDLHIHTVFSDGSVWPDIRIQEAVKDGLDAISLTEHLEYLPHVDDIPHPDRNRSYEIAKELALPHDLIVIHGAEITRDLPPGHANAIFIQDANKLLIDDPIECYEEAHRQGAFVFWNHPNWISQKEDGIVELTDMHNYLIKNNLLHGLEVVNDITYSDEALDITLAEGLTVIGTSDIHGLVDYKFNLASGGHRPILLVFAKERTEDSIKEALFAGRTVTWFDNLIAGEDEHVSALLAASIKVEKASYIGPSSVVSVKISNISHASYFLQNKSLYSFHNYADLIELPAHESITLEIKTLKNLASFSLEFEVLNAMIGSKRHADITLDLIVD